MPRGKQKTAAEKEAELLKKAQRKAERAEKAEQIAALQAAAAPKRVASQESKSPEAKAMEDRLAKWEAAVQASKHLQKHGVRIQRASDVVSPHLRRVSTGLMSLDLETGGGHPCGGIVTISGPPGSAKTFLCLCAAAQIQQAYGDAACIFFGTNEVTIPKDHARMAGFYIAYSEEEIRQKEEARVRLGLPPFTAEELEDLRYQVGQVVQATSITAEGVLGVIREAIDHGIFQLIILDSMNNLIPEDEERGEIGEYFVGRKATLLSQFSTQIPNALMQPLKDGSPNYTCLLVTKQVRANIGSFGAAAPTKESLGAWALDHNRLIGIELKSTDRLAEKGEGVSKWSSSFYGKKVGWYVNKGKSGCHEGGNGEFNYYYDTGIDTAKDLFMCGFSRGVIVQDGAWFTALNQKGETVARTHGKDALITMFSQDPGLVDEIRRAILVKAGIECLYR